MMRKQRPGLKAVGYVRASTGRQEITPKDQAERIEAYCRMAGLELVDVITERGVSAKIKFSKRPEGGRVLSMLETGIGHIVALRLDRLFRSASDALATVDEWQRDGIHLHLVDLGGMPLNTAASMGKMVLTMMAGFAEFERNIISERTAAALRYKRAHGQAFNHTPFGFDNVEGCLVPNKRERRVMERMRVLHDRGISYNRIAAELNEARVPSKRGGRWHGFSIMKILSHKQPAVV